MNKIDFIAKLYESTRLQNILWAKRKSCNMFVVGKYTAKYNGYIYVFIRENDGTCSYNTLKIKNIKTKEKYEIFESYSKTLEPLYRCIISQEQYKKESRLSQIAQSLDKE